MHIRIQCNENSVRVVHTGHVLCEFGHPPIQTCWYSSGRAWGCWHRQASGQPVSYPTLLKQRMVASAVKLVFGSSLGQCFPLFPSVWVFAQRPLSPQHATGLSLLSEVFSIRVLYRTNFYVIRFYRSVGEGVLHCIQDLVFYLWH